MRSASLAGRLLTHPIRSVKNRRLARDERQFQGKRVIPRLQNKPAPLPHPQLPVVNPRHAVALGKARLAERPARDLLRIMESSAGNFRHREVGQLDVTDRKTRPGPGLPLHALTEKRELIPVVPPIVSGQIPREIPPLSFELRVRMVIPRKFVFPTRQSQGPLVSSRFRRDKPAQADKKETANKETIHAALRPPRFFPVPASARWSLPCPRSVPRR